MRREYKRAILCAALVIGTTSCAGGLAEFTANVPSPAPIEMPVLYPGDTWTFRYNDGRRWRQTYDAAAEDGLLRGRGPNPGATFYFDHAHTLRKVYIDGTWLTWDTPDFPEIGKAELEFPLTVGKRWTTTWYRYAAVEITQDSWVAGCETVRVPAGTFVGVRIEVVRHATRGSVGGFARYTLWYAPAVKYWVKGTGGSATIADPFRDFVLEAFTIDAGKPAKNEGVGDSL